MDNLNEIFTTLRTILKAFENPLQPKKDEEGYYDLWSFKDLVIEGRKRNEVYFAGIITQKGYVGFYFMPVYSDEDIAAFFPPRLAVLRKGKSCFHIKKLDDELLGMIRDALTRGYDRYKERKWI